TSDEKAMLIGEGKFLRALSYFYLVRLFGDVPLVVLQADAVESDAPRAPAEAVYALIIQDAKDAAQSLPPEWHGNNAGRATSGAALTLLSKVFLTRQEWQEAAEAAKQVIDSGVYSLLPDYLQNFVPAYHNSVESVFALQASNEPGLVGSRFVDMYYPLEVG